MIFIDANTSLYFWFLVFVVIWDGYFWTTLLAVPLSILLPFFAVYLFFDRVTLKYIETDSFWRTIKRWCDSTTILIWTGGFFFGLDLYNDSNLPLLLLLQWFVLPINILYTGWWTIVLWPFSIAAVYITSAYYVDVLKSIE